MTTTSLASAMDVIAEHASRHLLVTHFVGQGKPVAAQNVLDLRICNLFDRYATADRIMEDIPLSVIEHIDLCLHTPGPLLFRAIKQAAARQVEVMMQ